MASSGVALMAPNAGALTPRLDLDRDGLVDGLERRIGLTPGVRDRIAFVHAGRGCSDRRNERAPEQPWCTLARAVRAAPAGATVLVRRGTYERATLDRTRPGRVRLRPYPGERAVVRGLALSGGDVRLEHLRITGPVEISARAGRVALIRNHFASQAGAIELLAGVRDVLVAGNRIAQRPGAGRANAINFSSTDTLPAIVGVTIRDNRIGPVPSGGDAIQAKHTRRLVIEDNEIFGVSRPPTKPGEVAAHPDAFQSIYGAERLTLKRNFIHDIAAQGIFVQRFRGENRRVRAEDNVIARVAYPWVAFTFDAQGAKLIHNTVLGTIRAGEATRRAILVANIATTLLLPPGAAIVREDHNLARRFTRRPGPRSVRGRPRFRDAGSNDFRLRRGSRGRRGGSGRRDIGSQSANWSRRASRRR